MSKKVEIKLALLDVEGCVTPGKGKKFNLPPLEILSDYCANALQNGKPPIVLCTGRPQPYAEAILQNLNAFFKGFASIVENGCFLYDFTADVPIPNPAIIGKEKDLRKIKTFFEETLISEGTAKIEPGKEICISLNPFVGMNTEELQALVEKALPSELKELVFITRSASAVDITPKGVDKASGLKFMSQLTGIDSADMLGIGDTRGDFPMLQIVGYPACPGNATQEVKDLVLARGGYIADANDADGIVEIFKHYGLID